MKNVSICHISTHQTGGAAKAALRLHDGLLAEGLDSHFICANPGNSHPHVHIAQPVAKSKWKKLLRIAHLYFSPGEAAYREIHKAEGKYESFGTPMTDYRLENHPKVQQADIIHLHWVDNFINYPSFFTKINKPVIWTFHDMNPFMGGFHYQGDLERNSQNKKLRQLDNKYRKIKKDALTKTRSLHIVSPSKWLYQESKGSDITGSFPHSHITYGLPTNIFRLSQKDLGRETFKLPPDKKMILFVSDNINNIRKGFDLLIEGLKKINHQNDFIIVAVGNSDHASYNLPNLYTVGSIYDEGLLALLYSTADVFILPSREDNFPNVMLEALVCGTPVIGFPVGGIKDAVVDGYNGILCEDVSASALTKAIEKFLTGPSFDHERIAADSVNKYALHIQAKKYIELYTAVLQKM